MTVPVQGRAADGEGFVDAHVHFWDRGRFDYPWLASVPELGGPFLPEHLLAAVPPGDRPAGVVAVEADRLPWQALPEARWLASLGDGPDGPALPVLAVVAHAPLELGTPDALEPLQQLAGVPRVRGIRRLLQDEPPGFATRPCFVAGAALLDGGRAVLDLCVRRHQLAEAAELAALLPEVTFVLDHLGKPRIDPADVGSWADDLDRLAALPNVRCKLSGLSTEATPDRRTAAHLLPYLRHALDAFGPGRCMFGSDWPVLTLAWRYQDWLDLVREAIADLPAADRGRVLRGTAIETYGGGEQR